MKKITLFKIFTFVFLAQTMGYGFSDSVCIEQPEAVAVMDDNDFNIPIPMTADFSVMARIELTDFDTDIFSWINLEDLENPFSVIDITPDGNLRFSIPGIGFTVIAFEGMVLNECYHIAVTCESIPEAEAGVGVIKLYINGEQEAEAEVDLAEIAQYISSLDIDPQDLPDVLVGYIEPLGDFLINEISIFDIPLEGEDIFEYNLNVPGGGEVGLVLAYNYSIDGFPFDGVPENWEQYLCEEELSTNEFDEVRIALYPNPTKNYISFSNLTETVAFSIYDALGKQIISAEIEPNKQVDVSALNSGIYFVQIDGAETLRLVKN